MMHRLQRYDVFRFAQNDVAPLRSAMMRCLPQCAVRHTSLGEAVIIGEANIICRRQTSFKKAPKSGALCSWVFARGEDSRALRLTSELVELRAVNANQGALPLACAWSSPMLSLPA